MLLYLTSTLIIIGITEVWCQNTSKSMTDACESWEKLRQTAENDDKIKFLCTINKNCIGMSCTGKSGNTKGTIETYVQHCTKPVSLVVAANVPQLGLNLTHTFFDGDSIPLPHRDRGTTTTTNVEDVQMAIHLQMRDESTLVLGVSVLREGQIILNLIHNQTIKLPPCSENERISIDQRPFANWPLIDTLKRNIDKVNIDQENESKVVLGTVTTDGQECNMETLGSCGVRETCEQTEQKSSKGICKCLQSYHRDTMGNCEEDPTVPSSTSDPSAASHKSDDDVLDAFEIIIPIVLLIVCGVSLAFFAYRYRWVPRLRSRFQQTRTYEEMVINGDDIAENYGHSLTNPTV